MNRLALTALGASLRVSTDVPGLAELLRAELGTIVRENVEGEPDLWLQMSEQAATVETRPIEAAFGIVFRAWLDRVDRYAVLHGAALVKHGRALVLAGPTGSGKTTLSLAMLAHGYSLLSDDFAPVALDSGRVAPFPKAFGVRPGAATRLAARAGVSADPELLRTAVDVHRLDGIAVVEHEVPVAAIALMNGSAQTPQPRDPYPFYVVTAGGTKQIRDSLLTLPGARPRPESGERIEVMLDPTRLSYDQLERWLDTHQADLLEYGTAAISAPGLNDDARLSTISPATCLVLLLREIQNRRTNGALMQRFGNDLTRLSHDLARVIAALPMTWLTAADPELTAARLDAWFQATTRR
ncbi:MAG: hypothetical protein U0V87_03970 [Acidobacteriota bacterium]